MGKVEEVSRKRVRKDALKRIILDTVKISGLLAVAVIAPNVVGAMAKLGLVPSPRQREVIGRSCERMIRSGLLVRVDSKLRLTKRGEAALRQLEAREYSRRTWPRWDGRWRILMFDVPEYRRGVRVQIRHTLQQIGFVRFQDSVWVFPYDCEDLITLLKADFHIGKDVVYLVADTLEGDNALRKHFRLR
ncbi:MAG: hypothetical protein AAB605_01365 [Patescibacteria group bacterium]